MKLRALFTLVLITFCASSRAQNSLFTYQGRLNSGSNPYTGVAEVQATLWDADTAGNQVAANNPAALIISVTNGLFVLPLDFGTGPFATGAERWLEIQLRTTLGPFSTLSPRQKITPTPYALRAGNAATAATANSVAATNVTGTLNPAQLPSGVLTNNTSGATLTGTFAGDGSGLTNITFNALGLTSSNVSVVAWGNNVYGQRSIPLGLDDVISVSPGALHSLALRANGTVVAWGAGTTNTPEDGVNYGQAIVPALLANVVAISGGYVHSLALRNDRTVIAWGSNEQGQGTVPPAVNNIAAISAGGFHNLALKTDRTVVAWGTNDLGALNVPPGLNNVVAVSAGLYHSMALLSDGTIRVWGGNQYGQTNVPPGLTGIRAISAGGAHSLVLRSNGTVVAWGAGTTNDPSTGSEYGQSIVPSGLSNVIAIAGGYVRSLALKSDGTVVGWGGEEYGAVVPVGLNNIVALGIGTCGAHSLALRKRFDAPVAVLDSDNTFNGSLTVNGDGHFSGDMTAGSLRLNDGTLFLRGGSDQNNGLAWFGPEKPFGIGGMDGPVLFGNRVGALGTRGTNGEQVVLYWDDQRRVGIGTATPSATLSLGDNNAPSKLLVYDTGSGGVGLGGSGTQLSFHLNGSGRFSFMGQAGGNEVMTVQPVGNTANVGIGTPSPSSRLDVRGDIRFGSSGQFYPPAGQENLRVIRGVVNAAGGILAGTGFTVSKGVAGVYTLNFTTAFTAPPTVTATADSQGGNSRVAMTDGAVAGSAGIRITVSGTGAGTDAPFHFIAMGPR